jgi:transposase
MAQRKSSEKLIRDIIRNTRRKYLSEEKIRIVIEGMCGETSIADLCRREGINQNLYYHWSKDLWNPARKGLMEILCERQILQGETFEGLYFGPEIR